MAHYETTIESPLSPKDAFGRLASVERFAEWDPGVSAARQVEGDGPGPDAAYVFVVDSFVGKPMELRYEVTDFEEPTTLYLLAESDYIRSDDRIDIRTTPTGCAVTYSADLDLTVSGSAVSFLEPAVGLVVDPLLGVFFKRVGDKAAAGLRTFLDAD